MLSGKVLITGGTGSLAKTILARAKRESWDCSFTIFSRDETKQNILKQKYPEHSFILGDIARYNDLKRAMREIDIVLHLAAYKQIPMVANNFNASIQVNVIGSQNVVDAAIDVGVKQVVTSSTDKAMSPENLYGCVKKITEYLFQDANKYKSTTFHITRYGNVLMSNQSVGLLFKEQAKTGGPLTITDSRMSRFFLTFDQAIDLLLKALSSPPGYIVVPKAPSTYIRQLAEVIGKGLPIIETQIRSGEKLTEGMVSEAESFYVDQDDRHFYIHPATSTYRNSEAPFSYMSDKPNRFITNEELSFMIEETERLYGV